jgi:hypothetical protein
VVKFTTWGRLLDFGVGYANDNVALSLANSFAQGYPHLIIYNGNRKIIDLESSVKLNVNTWYHVAGVYDGKAAIIYINGKQQAYQKISAGPRNVLRGSNYIGASNWGNFDELANAVYDDLRIYSRALSQSEIVFLAQY